MSMSKQQAGRAEHLVDSEISELAKMAVDTKGLTQID